MNLGFDRIANEYDQYYTFTEIGKLQRKCVLSYVKKKLLNKKKLNILELNCGTGEDAIYFKGLGHRIVATDGSSEMINVAKLKNDLTKSDAIVFKQLSFRDINDIIIKEKFDLVFSNFGGLNCISEEELKSLFMEITKVLKPKGRFVGIIMPKYCLWEIVYFFIKFQWKKIFRRNSKSPILVTLNDTPIKTWYYSPMQIKKLSDDFKIIHFKPIGIAIPPSYLEKFFAKKRFLLKILNKIELLANNIPFLAGLSDHFLFDMELSR